MKAVVIQSTKEDGKLVISDYALPTPGINEIRIKVEACGINRADLIQMQGNYPAPPGISPDIPGLEVSGIVESCGPKVSWYKKGDAVCALLAGGGYAEYVVVKEGQCLPVPKNLTFTEAAALPEALYTVWHNVFGLGQLKAGENFLVHGGSSGIGTTAIQLSRIFGAKTFVTVGSDIKGEACLKLGAKQFINYKNQKFEEELKSTGINLILDMIGGDYLNKNLSILSQKGRLVYINAMNGNPKNMNIMQLMRKQIYITGSTLRDKDYSFKKQLTESIYSNLWPTIVAGQFKPLIDSIYTFSAVDDAMKHMKESKHIGKIILIPD